MSKKNKEKKQNDNYTETQEQCHHEHNNDKVHNETSHHCCHNQNECCCEKKQQCETEIDTIQNLSSQIDEWKNKYLRAYADAENIKRRTEIDAKNMVDYKISSFAKDMIPLADNLTLAINSIKSMVDENVLSGLKNVEENFLHALNKNGITKIETVGKILNPAEHRVVAQIESDATPDTIVQELQAGYKLGDKIIREAMVATAKPKQ